MPLSAESRSILVTGAGGGIGSKLSLDLAERGYRVLALDRDGDALAALNARAADSGVRIDTMLADSRDAGELEQALQKMGSWSQPLHGSVLCAGLTLRRDLLETTSTDVELLVGTNLIGTFLAMRETAQALRAAGRGGSIVVITSINALRALPEQPIYSATKAAIESLVASAAVEFGPLGIRVNSVAPGAIITAMNPGVDQRHEVRNAIPLGVVGVPGDLTGSVSFLLGKESSYVTGATLVVDGGLMHNRQSPPLFPPEPKGTT